MTAPGDYCMTADRWATVSSPGGPVRRVLVSVRTQRHAIAPHIPPEAVHGGHGPLILVKPRQDPTTRIVNVGHQHTAGPAVLEPRMVGAIQLQQRADMRLTGSPGSVRALASDEMLDPLLPQPPPARFPH